MRTPSIATRVFAALCLGTTVLFQSGCLLLAAGAGAGGVLYVTGALKSQLNANVAKSYKATVEAVEDMGFMVVEKKQDAVSAEVVVRTSQDKRIQIKLNQVSSKLTEVQIRVGVVGDESLSMAILDRIKHEL